jgi:hypothetical protein
LLRPRNPNSRAGRFETSARAWTNYEVAPHLALLIDHLEALERRDIRRLVVAMPPRHGKSRLVSQLFPAWGLRAATFRVDHPGIVRTA